MSRKFNAIDLFSGAGGLSLGLQRAGFDLKLAVDNDKWSGRTYRRNFGDHFLERDIFALSGDDLLKAAGLSSGGVDLLAGGPPCQGFSVQRRGDHADPRNHLVLEYLRLVVEIRPRFFLMENVSGLMSQRGKPFLDQVISVASEQGYVVHLQKLDAAEYGVPQFRKRVILVGERTNGALGRFEFPLANTTQTKYRTVREAIADLPSPPADGSPHPEIANHAREARLSAVNIERLKHIPPGGGREDLPLDLQLPCHKNNPGHRHVDVYGRLSWDKPSGTITARFDSFTRGRFAHPVEHRSVTLREGARLQTFPDDFVFEGSREEIAKQIGNAIPPVFAEAICSAILNALKAQNPGPEHASNQSEGARQLVLTA